VIVPTRSTDRVDESKSGAADSSSQLRISAEGVPRSAAATQLLTVTW
jgi:hypothetical protein